MLMFEAFVLSGDVLSPALIACVDGVSTHEQSGTCSAGVNIAWQETMSGNLSTD
jgi:hypothetical protein